MAFRCRLCTLGNAWFSVVDMYNNIFPNVSLILQIHKSCSLSVFTNPLIQNHFRMNVLLHFPFLFSFCIHLLVIFCCCFLKIRCNSQTTQATELTQTRTQLAPPILPIKEGTRHGTILVSKDSDGFLQQSP